MSRWPTKLLCWDLSLKAGGWSDQVKAILDYVTMECDMRDEEHVDLEICESRLRRLNRQKWMLEANTKPMLRTYLEIYVEDEKRSLVKCNLPRNHRSLLAKLKMGVLPLQIEREMEGCPFGV